jgi:hypothetical protein
MKHHFLSDVDITRIESGIRKDEESARVRDNQRKSHLLDLQTKMKQFDVLDPQIRKMNLLIDRDLLDSTWRLEEAEYVVNTKHPNERIYLNKDYLEKIQFQRSIAKQEMQIMQDLKEARKLSRDLSKARSEATAYSDIFRMDDQMQRLVEIIEYLKENRKKLLDTVENHPLMMDYSMTTVLYILDPAWTDDALNETPANIPHMKQLEFEMKKLTNQIREDHVDLLRAAGINLDPKFSQPRSSSIRKVKKPKNCKKNIRILTGGESSMIRKIKKTIDQCQNLDLSLNYFFSVICDRENLEKVEPMEKDPIYEPKIKRGKFGKKSNKAKKFGTEIPTPTNLVTLENVGKMVHYVKGLARENVRICRDMKALQRRLINDAMMSEEQIVSLHFSLCFHLSIC